MMMNWRHIVDLF